MSAKPSDKDSPSNTVRVEPHANLSSWSFLNEQAVLLVCVFFFYLNLINLVVMLD